VTPHADCPSHRAINRAPDRATLTRLAAVLLGAAVLASPLTRALAADEPMQGEREPEPPWAAPTVPAEFTACARLRVDAERLACYDAAMRARQGERAGVNGAGAPTPASPARQDRQDRQEGGLTRAWGTPTLPSGVEPPARLGTSYLAAFWELDRDRKQGTFNFIGYRPNFFLPLHVSRRVNRQPASPNPQNVAGTLPPYRNVEAKMQLSIRTKIAQSVLLPGADLWFGYTQQSLWQLYSTQISAPFRSTDHEPELVYIVPLPADLPAGWKLRFGGLGLAHQSNGQALPLSRSWNRVYASAGLERGEFSVVGRLNQRLREDPETNDNPDLMRYRGRLDLVAAWTPGLATATLQWRTNLDRRGSLQLDWTFPVDSDNPSGLRYYVQAFSGYAETLLDYNFRQNALGAGVTLFGW
jgi:phospholipase A1